MRISAGLGKRSWRPIGLLLFAWAAAVPVSAQPRTAWDGAYTEAQATRGMSAYSQSCSRCHSLGAVGQIPLAGDLFWKSFSQKTVSELFDYLSTSMPNGAPGTLPKAAYEDISALILKSNGFPAGAAELTAETTTAIQIVPKDGGTALPADAVVRVVGCLGKNGASGWVVTSATAPVRAERSSADDATRALGTRKMELKFVITKLDPLVGSRVAVTGILIGADGVDGLNVTTVSRVAAQCP